MPSRRFPGSKFFPGVFKECADHCEAKRLQSFSSWRESLPNPNVSPSPVILAKHGFCYLGQGDHVRCVFCGLSKMGWTAEDRPGEVHLRESPFCPLYDVNNCSPLTGPSNVPIPAMRVRNINVALVSSNPSPTCTASRNGVVQPSTTDNDVDLKASRVFNDIGVVLRDSRREQGSAEQPSIRSVSGAHYSEYSDLDVRRQSFERSRGFPSQIEKEPLCRSGFFCAGYGGDLVICFDCGLMLHQWSPADVADIEHARFEPSCQFLIDNKGHHFVHLVQNELTSVGYATQM